MTQPRGISAEELVGGYEVLFDPLTRAAHLACLLRARLTRPDRWPTVEDALAFGRLYGVPGAELAAFFGYLGRAEGGRTVWVDALANGPGSRVARRLASRKMAVAFGFQCAYADLARRTFR